MSLVEAIAGYYESLVGKGLPDPLAADLTVEYQRFMLQSLLAGAQVPPADEPDMGFLEAQKQ